ncbi:hypothetical protein DYBT9275_01982 [Dyadobacter sp. CECT 9275]|uniref:Alpha/beta hydrolase n=1 Tax=Dyadobacter helix TaxID=2822344 RepID=A0A916N5H6_9BACT|nr:alpha/beta hydrolase-fold protein [Dyadobacter sp. CECT 9275]CAG4998348.1 hypothetical protein DYBT9275_01982 [Dyadobacter sp. CECT 9275]
MKNFVLTILMACVVHYFAVGQSTYIFSEGLAAGSFHQYGREAIYKDELALMLYKGKMVSPQAGAVIKKDPKGNDIRWNAVKADTSGRFRGDAFSNGYIYITYDCKKERTALLNVTGNDMVFVNGTPRGGDIYRYGWMNLPVRLKKGKNEFYIRVARFGRFGGIAAKLVFPEKPVYLSTDDLTAPNAVPGLRNDSLWLGLVVVNTSTKPLTGLSLKSVINGNSVSTAVPSIPALSTRKVGVLVNGEKAVTPGKSTVSLVLIQNNKNVDTKSVELETVGADKQYSRTFVSEIDGSIQYYAVSPQLNPQPGVAPALFFSVHGAEVQAISQARAYKPKDWGVLVAPTNRRPRGFNWEDWGRLDALEVLDIAKKEFNPDPRRIYLTGHSMGGHGTWFLGATYPDKWAAIAPSAGYPTLSSYGSHDGMIPNGAGSPIETILLRASNPSNVIALSQNYKAVGVYIAHGDADKTVSVEYARQMKKLLSGFHTDFSYYEYPGGGHWYGDISVDWPPIFNFFSWHSIAKDTATAHIDFTTANPGVSGKMRWATIQQQLVPLKYSRMILDLDKSKNIISGNTENVALLSLNLNAFPKGAAVKIVLDSLSEMEYSVKDTNETIFLAKTDRWALASEPVATQKNPNRSGTLKEPFRNRMVLVYATQGTQEENIWAFEKARYDAETWYYRGNGSVDIVSDKDFDPASFKDRGIVLYGNASGNTAWNKLLAKCPVKVLKGKIVAGQNEFSGDDLAAYFVWPRDDSKTASVAVISGTGMLGMQIANANQYFSGGSGFPDLMIFSADMLQEGFKGVKMAGFFGNDWSLEKGEFVINK